MEDCTIIGPDGVKFKANKNILARQSPVFRAMFELPMIEEKTGIVEIKDIESPVIEEILIFINSGKAPKLGEMTMDLLEAAGKYQIDSLMKLCEREFAKTMDWENVCELLIMAESYAAADLKMRSIDFIKMNAKKVMKSDGWKTLVERNDRDLFVQVLKGISMGLPMRMENENVCEFLVLANRYAVECLKMLCIDFIMINAKEVMKSDGWKMLVDGNYDVDLLDQVLKGIALQLPYSMVNENVCELLLLANRSDNISVEYLKIVAINYIIGNAKEVMKTEGWKIFVDGNHEELFDQIYEAIISKMNEQKNLAEECTFAMNMNPMLVALNKMPFSLF